LDFYYYVGDEPRSFGSILSPYDWTNHFVFGTIN
jgi:hypothetical protein